MNRNYQALLGAEEISNISYQKAKEIAAETQALELSAQELITRLALCFISKGGVEYVIKEEKELQKEIFVAFKKSGVIPILSNKSGVKRLFELKESFYQNKLKITNEKEEEEYNDVLNNAIRMKMADAPVIAEIPVAYEREIVEGSGVFEKRSYPLKLQKIDILDTSKRLIPELQFLVKLRGLEGANNVALKNKLTTIIRFAKVIISG